MLLLHELVLKLWRDLRLTMPVMTIEERHLGVLGLAVTRIIGHHVPVFITHYTSHRSFHWTIYLLLLVILAVFISLFHYDLILIELLLLLLIVPGWCTVIILLLLVHIPFILILRCLGYSGCSQYLLNVALNLRC